MSAKRVTDAASEIFARLRQRTIEKDNLRGLEQLLEAALAGKKVIEVPLPCDRRAHAAMAKHLTCIKNVMETAVAIHETTVTQKSACFQIGAQVQWDKESGMRIGAENYLKLLLTKKREHPGSHFAQAVIALDRYISECLEDDTLEL